MSQLLDKGRIVAAVSEYPAKENGQPLFNQDGSPKMKSKWMAIGELTKWQGDNGEYVKREVFLQPLIGGSYETREYWDSENNNQQQNNQQQAPQQQAPQQQAQQPPAQGFDDFNEDIPF